MSVVDLKSILNNQFILSPSNYNKTEINSSKSIPLSNLVKKIDKGIEVGSNSYIDESEYKFIRTAAFSTNYISIYEDNNSILSITPQSYVDMKLKKDDILICKDSNVGEVVLLDKDYPNYMFSSGVNRLILSKDKYYVYAIMKHQKFKEQLLSFIPKGATLKHAKDNYLKCLIPYSNDKNIVDYVSSIVRIIQNKELKIKEKSYYLEELIANEINNNQNDVKFEYKYPSINSLLNINRLDTGNYTKEFCIIEHKLKNYKNGYFVINKKNIKGGNTPKKRFIDINPNLKYCWITPTYINDNGTIDTSYRINCDKNNINENCLLIINRTSKGGFGEYVGISTYYDYDSLGKAQHNQGIYKVIDKDDKKLLFMSCLLNSKLYRSYCANLSMGSKMKELKLNNILSIPFPKFPNEKITLINDIYYNKEKKYNSNKDNFENDNKKWDEKAGIVDLYVSSRNYRKLLDDVIDKIYQGETISYEYNII